VVARTWTDDDLRAAIATSGTWTAVCRALGLTPGGDTPARLRRRATELGLDIGHLPPPRGPGGRTWSDDDLVRAVAQARTLAGVFRQLRLRVGGGAWSSMKRHIIRLDLDTSHWERDVVHVPRDPVPEWSDAEVLSAADGARSVAEVMRRLGLDSSSRRGRRQLERRLRTAGVDLSALLGQRSHLGTSVPVTRRRRRQLRELLVPGSLVGTSRLRERLIEECVLEPICSACDLASWRGGPPPLQLDHVDGDRTNNRLENLRLLCANCHAQTDTYCGRNIGAR
jgi:hypothetical protein